MIYFISGHRDITQEEFDANYVPAMEDAIDNGQTTWEDCEFIVGDCKGCDQMAAEYIAKYIEENMDDWDCVPCTLTIHHMFSEPRFRVGTKADEAEILEELLPKEELNAALLKLALDKGWYDDNEEHDIHPVQIPKNQMGIAVKELKAKYPAADGKKIADLVKANLCN